MNKTYSFFCIQILSLLYFIHIDYCKVYAGDLRKQESKLNTLIEELHSMYKDAFENEKTYITRRFFTKNGDSHYTLHVQKLKEVDGVKTHNLRLEGRSKRDDPIIYINNPVEARMPNPFLSIDQFKKVMYERVEKQKKEFDANRNQLINAIKQFKVFKHLENFPTVMKKKHVKQVVDISNDIDLTKIKTMAKLIKTALHNENKKVNKKRKQKVHASSTTESTDLSDELIGTARHKVNKTSVVNSKRKQKIHTRSTTESTNLSDKLIGTARHKVNKTSELNSKRKQKIRTRSTTESTNLSDKLIGTARHKVNKTSEVNSKRKQKVHTRSTTESTNLSDKLIGIARHKVNKTSKVNSKIKQVNKLLETVLPKVNKKRAHKVHVSRGTKFTKIPHIMTTTALPKTIANEEITIETTTDEKITTESTAGEKITTESEDGEKITTESTAGDDITTEAIGNQEINTETIADKKNITQTTVDDGITTNVYITTKADEEVNTEMIATEDINNEMIVDKKITVEIIAKEEIITEPVTTTKPTARTTRTKQLRPYVFMG